MPSQPPLDQIQSLMQESWNHGKLEAIDDLFAAKFTPHHPIKSRTRSSRRKTICSLLPGSLSRLRVRHRGYIFFR